VLVAASRERVNLPFRIIGPILSLGGDLDHEDGDQDHDWQTMDVEEVKTSESDSEQRDVVKIDEQTPLVAEENSLCPRWRKDVEC